MTTAALITAGYHRPDVAVKLEILRARFGYSEVQAAGLYNKAVTLAVVRNGELSVLEGRLEVRLGPYVYFVPKGHRTADEILNVAGIIGHMGGYGHTAEIARNAQNEFDRITTADVRGFLAKRELAAQEEAARGTADAIARIISDMQEVQEERQAADARILALVEQHEESAVAA